MEAQLDLRDLEDRVRRQIQGCEVVAETDGYYVSVRVVSDSFEGVRAVKRQQEIYGAFSDLIADGTLHAVNIEALAPSELD